MNRPADSQPPVKLAIPVLGCISPEQIQAALTTCERMLMEAVAGIPLLLAREWARRFPSDAGVYAVFDEGKLIYVGETGSLSARMADFLDSRTHVLRRNLGNTLFKDIEGFRQASAHERFTDQIEDRITEHLESRLTVTAVVVPPGRAEIETHLVGKYSPPYNNKGKRGSRLRDGNGKGSKP